MRKLIAAVIFAVAGIVGLATPAVAAANATACYDVSVTVNGEAVVDQAACETVQA